MFKNIIKYIIIAVFSIVIAKWILAFLPSSVSNEASIKDKVIKTKDIKQQKIIQENITLNLQFKHLEPKITQEYNNAQYDIEQYIKKELDSYKQECNYNLTKKDGFLDWIFGWGTGYQMVERKLRGYTENSKIRNIADKTVTKIVGFFSDEKADELNSYLNQSNNEVEFVENKFKSMVINDNNLNSKISNIIDYSKNRMEDFSKSVINIVSNDIDSQINSLKQQYPNKNITIDTQGIPWGKYITQHTTSIAVETSTFSGVGFVMGKIVGAKIGTILGPKVFSIVTAKTATIISGKIASAFSLVLAPIVDYLFNEGAKAIQYDSTKETFLQVIDETMDSVKFSINENMQSALDNVYSAMLKEINKNTSIKLEHTNNNAKVIFTTTEKQDAYTNNENSNTEYDTYDEDYEDYEDYEEDEDYDVENDL